MSAILQTCKCGKQYLARLADINRGWAKSCSKSCAAIKRSRRKPRYRACVSYRLNDSDDDPSWDAHKS